MTTRLLAALALLVAACSPAFAAERKIRWLLGHPNLDYFEEAAQSFKRAVEAGSGGRIEVSVETAANPWESSAGTPRPEIADKVARGEAEMGHSFTNVMGRLEPSFQVFDAPFLFTGYKHLEGVFDAPVGAEMLEGLREHGMIGLAFTYSGGAQAVSTTGRELRRPEDFKGARVAAFGSDAEKAWLSALGATLVPVGHRLNELAPLTERGEIDAAVVTWRRMHEARLAPHHRFVGAQKITYLASVTYVNEKFFESLPPADRELIRRAATEAARIERAKTIELNERSMREQVAKGVRPARLSDESLNAFKKALAPATREIEAIVGKKLMDRIRATPESAQHPWGIELAGAPAVEPSAVRVAGH